ncbi:MAG: nitroreductase family protein [Acidimicrobiia bacterium]|nr:nitroreductase family protein [Acidimicrobiia bacterium]
MCRAFAPEPIDPAVLRRIIDAGRLAPAAGNTREGRAFVVLEGAETSRYWDVTLPAARRGSFGFPLLFAAPVIVLLCVRPDAYAARYSEPDKGGLAATLGRGAAAWPQPFWWFDGGTAAQAVLVAAADEGLGGLVFSPGDDEVAVLDALGVPTGWRVACTLALGHPAPGEQRAGRSSARRRRGSFDEVVHRGGWHRPT